MRMPGFTADQSLYRQTTSSYSSAASRNAAGGNAVVPQGFFDDLLGGIGGVLGGIFGGGGFDFGCLISCGACLFTCGVDPGCWLAKCGPGCLKCIPH